MRKLVLIAILVAAPAWSTEVYRWVDSSGQPHYSDQWQPGAEKVRIADSPGPGAPQAGPASAQGQDRAAKSGTSPASAGTRYETLEIASPAQEEVLWNIEGQLRVSLRLSPALQAGHELRLYMDGNQQELPAGSTEAVLSNVFRGVHTLKAEVANASGQVLISSQPTTFVVRQTSLANPSRPRVP